MYKLDYNHDHEATKYMIEQYTEKKNINIYKYHQKKRKN